jgi:hypothetical protein
MNTSRYASRLLLPVLAVLSAATAMASEPGQDLPGALKACRALETQAARVECYDRLADGVPASNAAAPATAASRGGAATPAPQPPKEDFGLYTAEHPAAPKVAKLLTAKVVAFGMTTSGRQTAELDGGQLWELLASDPLLAKGDEVTITRAKLGSFLMSTPSGRSLRVRRLH